MQKAAKHIYVEVVYLTSVFLRHAVFFCLDMQGLIFIRKYKKKDHGILQIILGANIL